MKRFSVKKLCLDLLVIACLVVAGWVGYQLFYLHTLPPVLGSIIFLVDIGVLIWNIKVIRNRHWKLVKPSFKVVFGVVILIVLVCAFAGIQPLANYKDSLLNKMGNMVNTIENTLDKPAATIPTTPSPIEPTTESTPQIITIDLDEIERETFNLINDRRMEAGLNPIIWDDNLHSGARAWSETMQVEGNLYHDVVGVRIQYFAECIYGASWSGYRTPEQTVESWMNSSGHRSILMGSYRIGAIGIAKDEGFFATYRCKR